MELLDYLARTFGTCAAGVCCLLNIMAASQASGPTFALFGGLGCIGLLACIYIAVKGM